MRPHLVNLALVFLLWALGIAPAVSASDADDRAALETAAQSWISAFNAHDVDTLIALATPDIVLLDPEAPYPISSPEAVRKALRQATTMGPASQGIKATTKEIVVAGDVAWRMAVLSNQSLQGIVATQGQSLEIWKRVAGQWKLHRISAGILAPAKLRLRPDPIGPITNKPTD